jgi:hypothetical protein
MVYVANSSNGLPIMFDTGGSMSITPLQQDYIGDLEPSPTESLHGLKGKVKVAGAGRVIWTIFDLHGITRTIKPRAYFIPDGNIQLFILQSYLQENKKGPGKITADGIDLETSDGTKLTFPLAIQRVSLPVCSIKKVNQNITAAQKELLKWHWRLGHANFQWLMATPSSRR